jgi:uncharacterized protein (DUF4415 family)
MNGKTTKRSLNNRRKGSTDWARIDALTEKQIEHSISADPDSDISVDWKKARIVMPRRKESVHLRVDPDVLDWFRQQGQGHLTRMNAVLRAYVDAQRRR